VEYKRKTTIISTYQPSKEQPEFNQRARGSEDKNIPKLLIVWYVEALAQENQPATLAI
jgi:hypothetical protein